MARRTEEPCWRPVFLLLTLVRAFGGDRIATVAGGDRPFGNAPLAAELDALCMNQQREPYGQCPRARYLHTIFAASALVGCVALPGVLPSSSDFLMEPPMLEVPPALLPALLGHGEAVPSALPSGVFGDRSPVTSSLHC